MQPRSDNHAREESASAARRVWRRSCRRTSTITDLTLDSRERAVRRRIRRAAWNAHARHRLRGSGGERRRARDSVGADSRASRRRRCPRTSPLIAVPELTRGSARSPIVSSVRRRRSCASLGVTGTNGKTTTAHVHRGGAAAARHSRPRTRARSAIGRIERIADRRRTRRPIASRCTGSSPNCATHGVRMLGDGSVVARARSASRRRRALRHRRVHEPDARSSGLSRHVRSYGGGEGAGCSRGRGCKHAVINVGRCIRSHAARALQRALQT